jgi:hypothetical protein
MGARGGVVVKAPRYKPAGCRFDSRLCHWNFSVTYSYRSHYGPGIDSASNKSEYQAYFLGSKGGGCVRLTTLPPSCAVVMKSANPNFLEPSGPHQACNGTASPLYIYIHLLVLVWPDDGQALGAETRCCLINVFIQVCWLRQAIF